VVEDKDCHAGKASVTRKPNLYYNCSIMNTATLSDQFLSLRLGENDSALMQQLHQRTGLSKTEIVKQALRHWARTAPVAEQTSLYDLGTPVFGKYADASRQSAQIKSVVRERLAAKRNANQSARVR
jgi:Ribbon-helix-helix protein, copG family